MLPTLRLFSILLIGLAGGPEPVAGAERSVHPSVPLAASLDARESIRIKGRALGRGICAETQVKQPSDIKQKAWPGIQSRCGTLALQLEGLAKDDLSLAYSLCIGSALEGCQTLMGVSDPCLDLKACRQQLGVP